MKKLCILCLLAVFSESFAFEEIIITPNHPQGWTSVNVREDAIVEINGNQPLFGDGSLMFATDTITSGQDKADFQYMWQLSTDVIDFPDRTLGNVSALNIAWFRDSASTTSAHFIPAVRLLFFDDGGTEMNTSDDTYGLLIWEGVYNGINPAPEDSWELSDMINDNFWVYVQSSPGGSGVIQNYNSTLDDWINGTPAGIAGDPVISIGANTYIIGINTGVGSGWGNSFIGYIDAFRINFGNGDDSLYNFEQCDIYQPNSNPDVIFVDSFECFQFR